MNKNGSGGYLEIKTVTAMIDHWIIYLFFFNLDVHSIPFLFLSFGVLIKEKNNSSNLVLRSPSESAVENDVLCHCDGGKDTCHLSGVGARRGVPKPGADTRQCTPTTEKSHACYSLPQAISTGSCSLLQAYFPARWWRTSCLLAPILLNLLLFPVYHTLSSLYVFAHAPSSSWDALCSSHPCLLYLSSWALRIQLRYQLLQHLLPITLSLSASHPASLLG